MYAGVFFDSHDREDVVEAYHSDLFETAKLDRQQSPAALYMEKMLRQQSCSMLIALWPQSVAVVDRGVFYYTLGNLRPELRSTHKAIQLIACVSCPILGKYGFESILKPFIKDVNILAKVITALILIYCIHSNLLYLGWLVVEI